MQKPYERYNEVFIDEGENNMFAVMRELVRVKYTRLIYPEHPRGIDYDRERQGFRPVYTRAKWRRSIDASVLVIATQPRSNAPSLRRGNRRAR